MKTRNNEKAKIERDEETQKTIVTDYKTGDVTVFDADEKKSAWSLFKELVFG